MSTPEIVIVTCLIMLGFGHSVLGETTILRPLFAADWSNPATRAALENTIRTAWHATTIAWFTVAAIVAGVDPLPAVGVMSIVSAAILFIVVRAHVAWPLFLLAGLAAFYADGRLSDGALQLGAFLTIAALAVAAGVHVYWALGGTWLVDRALPQTEGQTYSPGPFATLAVAGALTTFAALIGVSNFAGGPRIVQWLTMAGIAVLTVRAVGDNKYVGLTKTVHSTSFGKADDRYFTPLIVFLALGATGSLL